MTTGRVLKLFNAHKHVVETYGPFEYIDDSRIDSQDPVMIWSVAEVDDAKLDIGGISIRANSLELVD